MLNAACIYPDFRLFTAASTGELVFMNSQQAAAENMFHFAGTDLAQRNDGRGVERQCILLWLGLPKMTFLSNCV